MTQLIVYRSGDGVLVCTDSAATTFEEGIVSHSFKVQKLFKLSPNILLATAGAGYGLALCDSFQKYVRRKGLWDYEAVAHIALPFFRAESQKFLRECQWNPADPELERIYFVIAGYSPRGREYRYGFRVIASDSFEDQLRYLRVPHFVVIPRRLALEYRLNRLPPDTALSEVELICEKYLGKLAGDSEEVAPPFDFAIITRSGIQRFARG